MLSDECDNLQPLLTPREQSRPRERSEEILIRCRVHSEISAPMWNVPNQRDLQAYAQWHSWRGRLSHWWHRRWQHDWIKYDSLDWAGIALPCLAWLRHYRWRKDLKADVVAGCTVAVMSVPQSLSYARIAGLPLQFGLYGAFAPVICYALFGSSRHLAVGPVAILSLLLSSSLSELIPGAKQNWDPNDPANPAAQTAYNAAAIQVSVLVGLMYLAVGTLRLGFLIDFLSHSVLSGFTTGAAAVIGISQVKLIFGVHVPRVTSTLSTVTYLVTHIREAQPLEVAMGLTWLAILLTMKHVGLRYRRLRFLRPIGPFTVALSSITCVWAFDLNVRTIGAVPAGLPPLTVSSWLPVQVSLKALLQLAATLTMVGLMESIAIAKALASASKQTLDANQELRGLGLANLVGAAFCCYPITGGLARSAVNADAGARSGIAGAVTAAMVGVVLLYLTDLTKFMPLNAMGSIVLAGVSGLLNFRDSKFLWRISKRDWSVWAVSMLGTILLGPEAGLLISVSLALLFVIYESATPNVVQLGRLPGTRVYRNLRQYPEAEPVQGMMLARVGASIYFANMQYIVERLRKFTLRAQEAAVAEGRPRVQFIVLDLSPVQHIDASAVRDFFDFAREMADLGVCLVAANPSPHVAAIFERSGLQAALGPQSLFVRVHDAVEHCRLRLEEAGQTDLTMP